MKCHYEVLNVSNDAEDSEIKTAYRKLALKWHPDKNLDNSEFAKEQFQIVQQAYEVLSDRQERAWYDRHREQILHGSNSEFEDNSLDVFQYFTTSCFKGYGDDENGFYMVYKNVFEKIAKEDMEYMDKTEFCEIPVFGNSKSDYDTGVSPFYDYWMSYSTKKSYVWLDPYDIKETRDRRVVKLIEKENKKVRQKAKKERNEEIRNLVAFVRKRDKRVQCYLKLMKEKSLQNKEKQESLRKQKRLESKQNLAFHSQPEWAKFDNVKSELEEIERHLAKQFGEDISNSDDEQLSEQSENEDSLYCIACNKLFKTVKAFENHESSKKHKENIEVLKSSMLDEEDEHLESDSNSLSDVSDNSLDNISVDSEPLQEEEIKKQKKKNNKSKTVLTVENECDDVVLQKEEEEDFDFNSSTTSKKKKKKLTKKLNQASNVDAEENKNNTENNIAETDHVETTQTTNNCKRKNKKQKLKKEPVDVDKDLCCITCKSNFSSKNKLFDHLKRTNHGVPLGINKRKTLT